MKEVAEYIGHMFSYVVDIQRSLNNKMKTAVPSPTSTTRTGDNRELSRNQKLLWEKIMTK